MNPPTSKTTTELRDLDAMYTRCQIIATRTQGLQAALSELNALVPRPPNYKTRRAGLLAEHTQLGAERRVLKAHMKVLESARRATRHEEQHQAEADWTEEQILWEISRLHQRQADLIGLLKARYREPVNEAVTLAEGIADLQARATAQQAGSAPEQGTVPPPPRRRSVS